MKKANFIKILMVFVLSCAIVFGCTAFFRPNLVTFAEQEPVVDPVLTWQSEENIEIATWYDELTYEDVTVFRISEAKQLSGLAKLVNSGVSFEGKIIKIQDTITLGKFIERYPNSIYRSDREYFEGKGEYIDDERLIMDIEFENEQ